MTEPSGSTRLSQSLVQSPGHQKKKDVASRSKRSVGANSPSSALRDKPLSNLSSNSPRQSPRQPKQKKVQSSLLPQSSRRNLKQRPVMSNLSYSAAAAGGDSNSTMRNSKGGPGDTLIDGRTLITPESDARLILETMAKEKLWQRLVRYSIPFTTSIAAVLMLLSIVTKDWLIYISTIPISGTVPSRMGIWDYCERDYTSGGHETCALIDIHCHATSCRTSCLNTCVQACERHVISYISSCSSIVATQVTMVIGVVTSIVGTIFMGLAYGNIRKDQFGTVAGVLMMFACLFGIISMSIFLGNVFYDADNDVIFKLGYSFTLLILGWVLSIISGVSLLLIFKMKFSVDKQMFSINPELDDTTD